MLFLIGWEVLVNMGFVNKMKDEKGLSRVVLSALDVRVSTVYFVSLKVGIKLRAGENCVFLTIPHSLPETEMH